MLDREIRVVKKLSSGNIGSVYLIEDADSGARYALKVCVHTEILRQEYDQINALARRQGFKMARARAFCDAQDGLPALLCMDYLDGVSASSAAIMRKSKRKRMRFAEDAVDNLLLLHAERGNKFGRFDDARFAAWDDFYYPFALEIVRFAQSKAQRGELRGEFAECLTRAYDAYGKIFAQTPSYSVLTHGDYWLPNLIADRKTAEFLGAIDPANAMWAEREYELFTLCALGEKQFGLYALYKRKAGLPDTADLKCAFYALVSELYWYSRTGYVSPAFLKGLCARLDKQMRRFGIVT